MTKNKNGGKSTSAFSGVAICVGTAIGAGIFSLPTVSSGMWLTWSIFCLLLAAFIMSCVSLMIMHVNMHFEPGDSFDTLVKGVLGKKWNAFNGLLFAFLMYILDYAYISGGSSIVVQTSQSSLGFAPSDMMASLAFGLSLSIVVWLSTYAVSRVIAVLLTGMAIGFVMVMADLSSTVELANFVSAQSSNNELPLVYYVFAALPFYLTSFGFHGSVPSLFAYYGHQPKIIIRSIVIGSVVCLVIYLIFLLIAFGNIGRLEFRQISADGGNIGVLVKAMLGNEVGAIERILQIFANMAVISSFLGVSLCLFDFIKDKFNFDDTKLGRLKAAVIALLPPTVAAMLFPDGFLYAIGFAGLVLAINALVIPALMTLQSQKIFIDANYGFVGNKIVIYSILSLGVVIAICHILAMADILPVY